MSESDAGIETQGDPDVLSLSCMYVTWEGIGVHKWASAQLQSSKS